MTDRGFAAEMVERGDKNFIRFHGFTQSLYVRDTGDCSKRRSILTGVIKISSLERESDRVRR